MNYKELKAKQEEELNSFSKGNIIVILASSEEEIKNKLIEENITKEDVVYLGAGLYLKKEAIPEYNELIKRHDKEYYEYFFNNVYEVVKYEAANYEMEISLKDALILEENSFLLRDEIIDVKVYLKNITENVTFNQLEPIDIGELDITQKMTELLKGKSSWFFNESEDFCTAYRSETDEIHSTYYLTRFHRNPDWNSNPTCIFFFRLSAFLLPGQGIRRKELLEDFTVRNCVSDMEYGIDTIFFNQDICRDYTDFKNLVEAFYDDIRGD